MRSPGNVIESADYHNLCVLFSRRTHPSRIRFVIGKGVLSANLHGTNGTGLSCRCRWQQSIHICSELHLTQPRQRLSMGDYELTDF